MAAASLGSLNVSVLILGLVVMMATAQAKTRQYNLDIRVKKVRRLCHSKWIVTANGRYPGPTIYAREGDTVLVNVTNHVKYNVSIHWHGVRQLQTGWADGPAYITQCPIQTGHSYVYNFTLTGQRGTLWWHAHIQWLRATLHGPLVIYPKKGVPYPFASSSAAAATQKQLEEVVLVLGQWWNSDTEKVINDALATGGAPNVSDAHTINGKPGPLYALKQAPGGRKCRGHTFSLQVEPGHTYLLRIINAALNDQLFFNIAGHTLTVVEIDATYVKPFQTKSVYITPGQTTNVLLQADSSPMRGYFMSVRSFMDAPVAVDNTTAAAILQYKAGAGAGAGASSLSFNNILLPVMPPVNDTATATNFTSALRSLNSVQYPARVPQTVRRRLLFTVGLGLDACATCNNGTRSAAAINNVTFVMPSVGLLQAHFFNMSNVFTTDFPERPPHVFNYTGPTPSNMSLMVWKGTQPRLTRLRFNESVELVYQDTSILSVDNHPIHLHGFNFFVVGSGVGNFDPVRDPSKFNLLDPPERNTVSVPTGGWAAIRWVADNPGVWFMHCHLEVHTTWGLKMAFLVNDGPLPHQKLPPPPSDLPKC